MDHEPFSMPPYCVVDEHYYQPTATRPTHYRHVFAILPDRTLGVMPAANLWQITARSTIRVVQNSAN